MNGITSVNSTTTIGELSCLTGPFDKVPQETVPWGFPINTSPLYKQKKPMHPMLAWKVWYFVAVCCTSVKLYKQKKATHPMLARKVWYFVAV